MPPDSSMLELKLTPGSEMKLADPRVSDRFPKGLLTITSQSALYRELDSAVDSVALANIDAPLYQGDLTRGIYTRFLETFDSDVTSLVHTGAEGGVILPPAPTNTTLKLTSIRPLTINGYKFDLRMYVCITDVRCRGVHYPRVYLHHEGLTRFCTTPYQSPTRENMKDDTVHLSNYSVNKWSSEFVKEATTKTVLKLISGISEAKGLRPLGGEYVFGGGVNGGAGCGLLEDEHVAACRNSQEGSKWTLTAFGQWCITNGYDIGKIWRRCKDLVAKVILAAVVVRLRDEYNVAFSHYAEEGLRCFELLGIDIMLTEQLKPLLLEVNMSPSAAMGSGLDRVVKESVHQEVLMLAAQPSCPTQKETGSDVNKEEIWAMQEAWRDKHEREVLHGFERVLPVTFDSPSTATYTDILRWKR